jgi:cation diffusion facilitator family transporter
MTIAAQSLTALPEAERATRIRRVLLVAMGLNAAVAVAKIVYGSAAHSLAIEADGYHSLTDGFVSLVALIGLGLARRPADERHPYGHRKIEVLGASAIGISLLFLSARIGGDVMGHVRDDTAHAPAIGWVAFAVLLVTLGINLGVSAYQTRAGRRLGSALLESDGKHTRADCYVTLGVLLSTGAAWAGFPALDVPAAAAVAVLIAVAGFEIVAINARYLIDVAVIPPAQIRDALAGVEGITAIGTIRSRGTPDAVYVDLRLRLASELSVGEADGIVRNAAAAITAQFDACVDVVVHIESDGVQPRVS